MWSASHTYFLPSSYFQFIMIWLWSRCLLSVCYILDQGSDVVSIIYFTKLLMIIVISVSESWENNWKLEKMKTTSSTIFLTINWSQLKRIQKNFQGSKNSLEYSKIFSSSTIRIFEFLFGLFWLLKVIDGIRTCDTWNFPWFLKLWTLCFHGNFPGRQSECIFFFWGQDCK